MDLISRHFVKNSNRKTVKNNKKAVFMKKRLSLYAVK